MVKSVTTWASGIAGAFNTIRGDADKASDAVGRDGKSGLRGRLGALKSIGKIGITIAIAVVGLAAADAAIREYQNPDVNRPDAPWRQRDVNKD